MTHTLRFLLRFTARMPWATTALTLAITLSLVACAGVQSSRPVQSAYMPENWTIESELENQSVDSYLSAKRKSAASRGNKLFVYLYADWDYFCRHFRRRVIRGGVEEAFDGVEILMLGYEHYNLLPFDKRLNLDQPGRGLYAPVMLQVQENGVLGPAFLYPTKASNWSRRSYPDTNREARAVLTRFFSRVE